MPKYSWGGNLEPKVIVNTNPSGRGMNGNVFNPDNIAPTLTTNKGEGPKIVAMRGRNPKNPSDRTVGAPTEQRLEINSQGVCNTITSVQKDNMVLENTYLMPGNNFNQRNAVHTDSAVCRTLISSDHSGNEPKVLIKQATKEGYVECELGGVADLSFPDSKTRRGRVQESGQVSPTLTATGSTEICKIESRYRIRKLTCRECGRLMAVNDDNITRMVISSHKAAEEFFKQCEIEGIRYQGKREFDKAERIQKMSNSQLYKQYGNSIVVTVMVAMFSNLNIQGLPRWDEIKEKYM